MDFKMRLKKKVSVNYLYFLNDSDFKNVYYLQDGVWSKRLQPLVNGELRGDINKIPNLSFKLPLNAETYYTHIYLIDVTIA